MLMAPCGCTVLYCTGISLALTNLKNPVFHFGTYCTQGMLKSLVVAAAAAMAPTALAGM